MNDAFLTERLLGAGPEGVASSFGSIGSAMIERQVVGRRSFTEADQLRFALASGDRNPMHMDEIAARRTQAGVPVVHGVHLLLWSLEALARQSFSPSLLRIKASFTQFVPVNETVTVVLARRTESGAQLDLELAGITSARIILDFGSSKQTADPIGGEATPVSERPLEVPLERMEGLTGRLAFASTTDEIASLFPQASSWIGRRRVATLAATSKLVGMVCPGLHSIYCDLATEFCNDSEGDDELGFRVVSTDSRFRLARLAIAGGGLVGSINSIARPPPRVQASSGALTSWVEPNEFIESTVLVVGGSRGLGEVTAKLLAAGGAKVIVTYRVGKSEAEAVAEDIRAAGGACDTLAYDARQQAEKQLTALPGNPSHAYYFATPTIYRAQSTLFDRLRFEAFLDVYVDGFFRLAQALRAGRRDVALFYPSSVYVAERPRGMLEYAMAKAAGETLCNEMNLAWPLSRVTIARLPRLPTDQTASVIEATLPSPAPFLLPALRETQSWPHAGNKRAYQ